MAHKQEKSFQALRDLLCAVPFLPYLTPATTVGYCRNLKGISASRNEASGYSRMQFKNPDRQLPPWIERLQRYDVINVRLRQIDSGEDGAEA